MTGFVSSGCQDKFAGRTTAFQRPVRVGNPVEGIAPADGYRQFAFHPKVEEICKGNPEGGWPEEVI